MTRTGDVPLPPLDADGRPLDDVAAELYDRLRAMAQSLLSRERGDASVDATDLVHECYLRLARLETFAAVERTEFLALAATLIRNVLVDLARRRRSAKRGGGWRQTTLAGVSISEVRRGSEVDLVELDEALRRLAKLDERQHRIVELRFFGGLSGEEISGLLGVSRRTVTKEWTMARAWLKRELGP